MPPDRPPTPQWTLDLTIFHEAGFGHVAIARVLGHHGGWHNVGSWRWRGLGVPEEIVTDLQTRLCAVVAEHLITRYGVQGQLPTHWAGEPGT